MVFLRTSLLLDVNDRAETGNFERPVQEVCADAVHGRVDDLDAAPRVHGLVVDERAEVFIILLGERIMCTYDISKVQIFPFPLSAISRNLPN